jgi:two-component system OmpR family sensor kinase
MEVFGHRSLRTRAFWKCFGILVLLAAVYGAVFALFLAQRDLLETSEGHMLAWQVALVCWLLALPPIWLIARLESRWVMRHVREPIASIVRQCGEIRDGRTWTPLRAAARCDELRALSDSINDLLAYFNQLVVRQHRFAADAAHELRTPLTAQSVVGESALARRCSNGELREAIGSMLEESKHMKRLIENLLELSRATAVRAVDQQSPRDPIPIELGALARGCVESLRVLAEEKHQRIELSATHTWADGDSTMVRQALLNVIHNAIEHCPDGTRIQVVTARFAAEQAMIRVSDNGPGIPLDQQEHVFKRFHRVPGLGRRRGLGLGLAIAKALLKSQRGNIYLRSEPGEGCCFTLTLPWLPEPCTLVEPEQLDSPTEGLDELVSAHPCRSTPAAEAAASP